MTDISKHSPMGRSLLGRFSIWWKSQSRERRKTLMGRTGLASACIGALVIGFPVLSGVNADRQQAAELRDRSARLAIAQDAGYVMRSDKNTSALLRHDWLRSVEYSLERDPASALSRYAALERDRAALYGLKTFDTADLSRAEDIMAQRKCLATAIYYEARSERTSGQLAVAEVIMNRVKDHRYPNTVCDVVYQGATRTTGCQFTFTCDGAMRKKPYGSRWTKAQTLATHVVMGLNEQKTSGATHYHATYVNPVWNSGLVRTRKIGTHIFYRFPRGGEWAKASARQKHRLNNRGRVIKTEQPAIVAADKKPSLIKAAAPAQTPAVTEVVAEASAPALLSLDAAAAEVQTSETVDTPQAPATKRYVRRIVDGVVVEETEIPAT